MTDTASDVDGSLKTQLLLPRGEYFPQQGFPGCVERLIMRPIKNAWFRQAQSLSLCEWQSYKEYSAPHSTRPGRAGELRWQ